MSEVIGNTVWVNGVQLNVQSGDVSWVDNKVNEILDAGGGWLTVPLPDGGEYKFLVSPALNILFHYSNF